MIRGEPRARRLGAFGYGRCPLWRRVCWSPRLRLLVGLGGRVAGTDLDAHPDRRGVAALLTVSILVVIALRFAVAPGLFNFFG
jgi:hypothetical protein